MNESKEREAYRKACRYYGVDGSCYNYSTVLYSGCVCYQIERGHVSIICTPDCDCARMRRYDKLHKLN